MRYTLLGHSGLRVSEVALGTMTFGPDWGWGASVSESRKQFDLFAEAGGTFVDTANKYTDGTAEKLVGEFVAADRDRFVLATKYSLNMRHGDLNAGGNHRKNLVASLDASLRRLDTDYVDVFWLHAWDYLTPVAEIVRALDDQVRAGKVLYVGVSDTPAWIVAQMQTIAELRGWTPFVGLQVEYSLVQRESERELLPMARALGLGVTAWGPLGAGVLSGKYSRTTSQAEAGSAATAAAPEQQRLGSVDPAKLRIAAVLGEVAEELGLPPTQVALAWLATRPGVVPILGARTSAQLATNLGYLDVTLPEPAVRRLDEVSAVALGFPHDFLASTDFIHGGAAETVVLPPGRTAYGR